GRVRRGVWRADEYCPRPAGGLAVVLPPGAGTGGLPRVGVRLALTAELTAAGRSAIGGGDHLGLRQRAAIEHLEDGPQPAALLVRAGSCDHSPLRSLDGRGPPGLPP